METVSGTNLLKDNDCYLIESNLPWCPYVIYVYYVVK